MQVPHLHMTSFLCLFLLTFKKTYLNFLFNVASFFSYSHSFCYRNISNPMICEGPSDPSHHLRLAHQGFVSIYLLVQNFIHTSLSAWLQFVHFTSLPVRSERSNQMPISQIHLKVFCVDVEKMIPMLVFLILKPGKDRFVFNLRFKTKSIHPSSTAKISWIIDGHSLRIQWRLLSSIGSIRAGRFF